VERTGEHGLANQDQRARAPFTKTLNSASHLH